MKTKKVPKHNGVPIIKKTPDIKADKRSTYVVKLFEKNPDFKPQTQKAILEKLKKEYPHIEELQKMGSGTMSKVMKELGKGFYSKSQKTYYVIEKASKVEDHFVLRPKEDSVSSPWHEYLPLLQSSNLLISDQMCQVSPYMYIFKLNTVVRYRAPKKGLGQKELVQLKAEYQKEKMKERRKKVISYFKKMINQNCLFDICKYGDDKIAILLNNNADEYAILFNDIFK